MGRPRKVLDGDIEIEVTRDGVFVADDLKAAKGEKHTVPAAVATVLIENGHAKPV